ncbi:hypothetical protein BDW68DRAFT_169349 [Aspergillus falconensis]
MDSRVAMNFVVWPSCNSPLLFSFILFFSYNFSNEFGLGSTHSQRLEHGTLPLRNHSVDGPFLVMYNSHL